MLYTIIEDASPYYIRFTFDGLLDAINEIKKLPTPPERFGGSQLKTEYTPYQFDEAIGSNIVEKLGLSKKLAIQTDRIVIVETPPWGGCGIHKDGAASKTGINVALQVVDQACITSWYNEEDFKNVHETHSYGAYSRNAYGDFKIMNKVFTPAKTVIVKPGEMVLLNTDLWHSWDNTKSANYRKLLTLKVDKHNDLTFDEVKQLLFQ